MRVRIAASAARLLAASMFISGASVPAKAQARAVAQSGPERSAIDGVITDSSLVPLSGATISILGSDVRVVTASNGRFRLVDVPSGQLILFAHRLGFEPASARVQVANDDTLRMAFSLRRVSNVLDTVRIAAPRLSPKMAEFDARRRAGFGHFMTQQEIEKRNDPWVAELLATFSGVDITSGRTTTAINRRSSCMFDVQLDGIPSIGPVDLDELPSSREIAGIEVYLGPATIPLQYKRPGGGNCGLILIWTKDGSSP